jgi:hypothetical protein
VSRATKATRKRKREDTEFDRFMDATAEELSSAGYLNRPLAWWREHGEKMFPTLSILAYNVLSMPGMSAECERVFSQAKRMVTDERFNLRADIIEAEQCLKSWLISGLVDGSEAWKIYDLLQDKNNKEANNAD